MEESKALKEVENSLRDFISNFLEQNIGKDWLNSCGVTQDRISIWKERKENDEKKQKYSTIEKRLLYYSDFYDLINIIDKNWNKGFKDVFVNKTTTMVFLDLLKDFRNPEAHRREFLPYQKKLIVGISGEIRNRIILYRSKKETGEDYFPRLESVKDNLGNTWVQRNHLIDTQLTLRVGDTIQFLITAIDPLGENLEYSIYGNKWQNSNFIEIKLTEEHISKRCDFLIAVRSKRSYHAFSNYDDVALFQYQILPKKVKKAEHQVLKKIKGSNTVTKVKPNPPILIK